MKSTILLVVSLAVGSVPQLVPQLASAQAPGSSPSGASLSGASPEVSTSAEPGDGKVRRAQTHFQRGVLLYEEANYEGAFAEFSRAHELVPNYRILYNLAQTQVERHDYVEAVRLFGEYLDQGGSDIPAARRQAAARERDSLLERIATVQVETNVGGAELWVDGRSRGVVPSSHALRLNSGHTELRVQKQGYLPVTRDLTLAGGDSLVVDIALQRAMSAAPEPSVSQVASDGERSHAGIWVSAAATTLFAGATATFAILTVNANRDLDRELDRFQPDATALDDSRSRVRTLAALTDGFGVATGVGLASMLYFIVRDSGAESVRPSTALAAPDRGVRLLIGTSSIALRSDF